MDCACVRCFLKISLEPYFVTAVNYGFKTLVDICKIVDRLLLTLKSHQNVIQNLVKILNSAPSIFRHSKLNPAMHWSLFILWVVN